MVKYPTSLDTDAELPRVDDNITEIGGEAINAVRAAVFAIEKALGVKPQGTAADLASRLAVSLDNNGNIKASALSGIGLVTLPITDAQVGSAAGIEESKLDLDYGTALLKSWIDSLRVRVDALEVAVATDIAHLSQHVAHPATWGRHTAGDVDAYDVFLGFTVQGALTNLDTRLEDHVSDPVDAHDGSAISLDPTRFTSITATDVQTGAEQLEDLQLVEIVRHRDRQHGNGILGTQDTFVSGTRHGVEIIAASATTSGSAGDAFIKFASTPDAAAFQSIARNDRIDLTVGGTVYTFVVESTQSTNQVNIFGQVPVSGSGMATVYRNSEETVEPSAAMLCLRKDDLITRPSTLQLVHPSSPYLLSSDCQPQRLSTSYKYLRLLYPNGDTGDLDVYAAMTAFSASPKATWTVENLARVLNSSLLSPGIGGTKHPIVAFAYKGELGLAYDLPDPDGYISIGLPTATDATSRLGFLSGATGYAMAPRDLYIDGYEIPGIRPLLDAYGQVTSGDTITFPTANPLELGVREGQLAKLSVWARGTYVIASATTSAIVFDSANEYDFSSFINKWVRVRVYADAFSIASAPANRTLYELFLDGYDDGYGPVAGLQAAARVGYADTPGGGAGLESVLDITAVSRSFGSATRRAFYDYSARTLVLGTQVAGPSVSDLGIKVTLPSSNEQGFRFTLYDANGADYLEFEIANALPGSDGYMDVTIHPRISEERFLQVATVLHNKTRFTQLKDTRQFGTVGRQDVRDDFTRDYVSYPRSLLRGNGAIYGLSCSGIGASSVIVYGGEVLVNGQVKSIAKTTIYVPVDGVGATYNIFVDSDGRLRMMRDDYFSSGILSTPSLAELLTSRTQTALAQVTVNSSNIVTDITDLRRFVNDIDSKLDLMVEENGITHGSFASLAAATAYLSKLPTGSPASRRIRVKGEFVLSSSVTLPDHVVLEGDGYGPNGSGAKITYMSSSATIKLGNGNIVRDLAFYRSGTLSYGFLSGTSISNTKIENCGFEFASQADGNIAISCGYLNETKIADCRFANVGKGIWADQGGFGTRILNNVFDGAQVNAIVIENPSSWGANNMLIAENLITTAAFTDMSGAALIRLKNPWATTVRDNMLTCTSGAGVVNRAVLHIEDASFNCRFMNNAFGNGAAATGFAKAIWLDGGVSHVGDIIKDNVIGAFSGNSLSKGIHLTNCNATFVSGNYVTSCRTPLEITEGNWIQVCNNNLVGVDNATVLNIDAATYGEHFIVRDNFIANADISSEHIVVLTDVAGMNVFSGNTVKFGGLPFTTTSGAGLYIDGPEWIVISNEVGVTWPLAFFVTNAPITLSANATLCMLTYNDVWHALIFGPATRIDTSAVTDAVERMNKGQTYVITLDLSRGLPCRTYDGWEPTSYTGAPSWENVSTNDGYLGIQFGQSDVPPGATITEIKTYYHVNDVGSDKMTCFLEKFLYNSGDIRGTALVLRSTHLNGTSGTKTVATLNIPATFHMEPRYAYILLFQSHASIAGYGVHGIQITYSL